MKFSMQKNKWLIAGLLCVLASCKAVHHQPNREEVLNGLAEKYVRLGLNIGRYDEAFVDAYYGPDSLKPVEEKQAAFPKEKFLAATDSLQRELKEFVAAEKNDTLVNRANWMGDQLTAFSRRIKIFSGEYASFDEESKELFGVVAPTFPETYFQQLAKKMDSLLPGQGNIASRFQALANRFIIPKEKLDTLFKTAIAESRKRTLAHYPLPDGEKFSLEYVTHKPWSGYNWYKGNFTSLIQINTDLKIFLERVIDVGSHESYPGHHLYNMLLEKNLYKEKGWVEISLYPLFSPQSLIAEGSANYGIEMAFPGNEKIKYAREVLLPLAGLDTTGIDLYFKTLAVKGQMSYARNEVGRGLLSGAMTEAKAMQWLMNYALMNEETAAKSISFIQQNRSYVINYSYGMELVKNYIERGTNDTGKSWQLFGWLLSNEVRVGDLEK